MMEMYDVTADVSSKENLTNDESTTEHDFARRTIREKIIKYIGNSNIEILWKLFFIDHFNPDADLSSRSTPLTLSTFSSEVANVFQTLLEMGANVNGPDGDGDQAIHMAAYNKGGVEGLDVIIYHVFKSQRDYRRKLVLNIDAFRGRREPITMPLPLNHFKRDFDVRDGKGRTALHHAAKGGQTKIINYLLNHGADVNARDREEKTPLHLAVKSRKVQKVFHLLYAGADINAFDNRRRTPFTQSYEIEEIFDLFKFVNRTASGFNFQVKMQNQDSKCVTECKVNISDTFKMNKYLLKLFTTYFLKKLKKETGDLAFFSRIRENEDYLDETIFDEEDF